MARTKISEFSSTPANNTDIDSINLAEGCAPSGINDAIRELMAQLKDFQTGAVGDSFNGPVGTTTPAAGAFTTLSATGNVTLGDASTDTLNVGNGGFIKDASGNLGLGVTPSAWGGSYKAFQLTNTGRSLAATGAGAGDLTLAFNAIYDSTDSRWEYAGTGDAAVRYSQTGAGIHAWYTAASGTAGNAITFTQAMTLDASGNLLLGTTSTSYTQANRGALVVNGTNQSLLGLQTGGVNKGYFYSDGTNITLFSESSTGSMIFGTNNTERARITSSGNLLVGGTTSNPEAYPTRVAFKASLAGAGIYSFNQSTGADSSYVAKVSNTACYLFYFDFNGANVGSITTNGTTTAYNTTSDYRLKENIAPMTGALSVVQQLKPCTYTWKADGSDGQGFIAHELQAVVPNAVHGKKDAFKEDGTPIYQGVDSSFLVATLTAAIQEQQAIIESLKARLDAANL